MQDISSTIFDIKNLDFSVLLNEVTRRDRRNSILLATISILYYPLKIDLSTFGGGIEIGKQEYVPLILLFLSLYFLLSFFIRLINTLKTISIKTLINLPETTATKLSTNYKLERVSHARPEDRIRNYYLFSQLGLYESLSLKTDNSCINTLGWGSKTSFNNTKCYDDLPNNTHEVHPHDVDLISNIILKYTKNNFMKTQTNMEIFFPWVLFNIAVSVHTSNTYYLTEYAVFPIIFFSTIILYSLSERFHRNID